MKITEIKINLVKPSTSLLGYATVVIDDAIVIRGIKILNGNQGIFIAFPNKGCEGEGRNRKYLDIVHPKDNKSREEITKKVLEAYRKAAYR